MASTINIGASITYKPSNDVRRNDIAVFYSTGGHVSCLRVVGLPGDKIEILNGKIFINDKEYKRPFSSEAIYTVYSKTKTDFSNLQHDYEFKPYSDHYGMLKITQSEYDTIKSRHLVDSIQETGADSTYKFPEIVSVSTSKYFNHYWFGPIYVPKKGEYISKSDKMLIHGFYDFDTDRFLINDDYYFCLGDSFSDAMDSRIIGLIPKEKIIGIVKAIKNTKIIIAPPVEH